jgi:GntR family transcriptional regulator/MocR family aminotransferase
MPAAGGGSCWVSLPEPLNATELAEQARDRGVLIEPGEVFFMAEPPPTRHFRMGYSSIVPAAIEPGVKALAELVRGFQHQR